MEERFNFNVILNGFLIIIPINIFIIFIMTVYRFVFFLYFADFAVVSALKLYVLKAFWMGFRFDLSVVAYINAPITLLFLICLLLKSDFIFKFIISLIKYYYSIIFPLIFLIFFVDFGFFSYFKDHYNMLIFGLFEDDTVALIKTILSDYRFYIAIVVFCILSFVIFKISCLTYKELKYNERIVNTLYWKKTTKFFAILLIIFFNFIFARGSFSMFPLGLFYSQISPDQFINKLCINPIHPLADTIYLKIKNLNNSIDLKEKLKYDNLQILQDLKTLPPYKDIENVSEVYNKVTKENKKLENNQPNVILIVLEGFGELPILNNSKDFDVLGELKQHFNRDIVFYNFLASGVITIHAIESISLNIPQRPFVNQITQSNDAFKVFSSSMVLPYKKAGYHSTALYGGSMTWRDLEGFFKVQGFDDIIGEGNVVADLKDRHSWGINDDKLFELLRKQLFDENENKPKFIFAISTQTHPPYKISPDYKSLPLEIPQNIKKMMSTKDLNNINLFKVYQSANRELAKFISDVKKSKFADNTIIAVTGDHNLRELSNVTPDETFLRYAVPFYLYIPESLKDIKIKDKKNINLSVFGSHMDIMPTLYNLSLSSSSYVSFGNDLLNTPDNVSFNVDGLVLNDNIAIKYNFIDDSYEAYLFDNKTKKLKLTTKDEQHNRLVNYYKAMMILADEFVKQD